MPAYYPISYMDRDKIPAKEGRMALIAKFPFTLTRSILEGRGYRGTH
jgi:hypothetical protein